jgi:hypothetical protein
VLNAIYVYHDHAYADAKDLREQEHVSESDAEKVRYFFPRPKLVYRVSYPGFYKLTTAPEEVSQITRRHPEAVVEVIPVH